MFYSVTADAVVSQGRCFIAEDLPVEWCTLPAPSRPTRARRMAGGWLSWMCGRCSRNVLPGLIDSFGITVRAVRMASVVDARGPALCFKRDTEDAGAGADVLLRIEDAFGVESVCSPIGRVYLHEACIQVMSGGKKMRREGYALCLCVGGVAFPGHVVVQRMRMQPAFRQRKGAIGASCTTG